MAIRVLASGLREAARAVSGGCQETANPSSGPCDRRKREAGGRQATVRPPELQRALPASLGEGKLTRRVGRGNRKNSVKTTDGSAVIEPRVVLRGHR